MTTEDCSPSSHIAVSPRDARQFVRRTLVAMECDDAVDDAELLVSEVVTNAVLHGGGKYAPVSIERVPDGIRIEVVDPGAQFAAEPVPTDLGTPGGLGLAIVDSIADRWGVTPSFQGKVVWFEMHVD